MAEERVQKILARAGYGSRRASEELITAGRVKINGQVAVLGSRADPNKDTITVDNQQIARAQEPIYIALNKPTGILSEVSLDEPRQTVRDLIPVPGHMFIVGRLDMESEGLVLLTNDGELANRLTHPRYGHEKEYRVLVGARPDSKQLDAWKHGVVLEDGYRTAPALVRMETVAGKGAWLRVILREGRKRQIREMGKQTGLPVLRILRIRIGSLLLGELKPGEWRHLNAEEVRELRVSKPQGETPYRASPGRRAGIGRPARSAMGGAPRGQKLTDIRTVSSDRPARRGEGTRTGFRRDEDQTPRTGHEDRQERPSRFGRDSRDDRPGVRGERGERGGERGRSTGGAGTSAHEGFNRRDDEGAPSRGPERRSPRTGGGARGSSGSDTGRTGGAGRPGGGGRAGNAGRTGSRPGGAAQRPAGRRPSGSGGPRTPRTGEDRPTGDRRPSRPARSPRGSKK